MFGYRMTKPTSIVSANVFNKLLCRQAQPWQYSPNKLIQKAQSKKPLPEDPFDDRGEGGVRYPTPQAREAHRRMESLKTPFRSKEDSMDDAGAKVIELIFGSWRSQILYAGVQLGVFEALGRGPASAVQVARELQVDAPLLYRLMRALGSLELVHEDPHQRFTLTPLGEVLCRDHPQTLRGLTLLEAGPEHYAAWMQLSELVMF
jgi:hypothetical protein